MSALSLKNVSVSYGSGYVVHDVSLDIREGEIFGLMGLNGAGKTTIIKSILGLRRYDKGEVLVFGEDKVKSEKNISFLPEKFEPAWFLTGLEFVRFSLGLYKISLSDDDIFNVAESLALDSQALKKRVYTYSKGMRQKIGLMGTLLTQSKLIILDEPMSGLDPKARALVKNMIKDRKIKDSSVLMCSHVLSDMDEICDRVALLHNGSIRFIGAPSELKAMTHTQNLEQAFLEFIEVKAAI